MRRGKIADVPRLRKRGPLIESESDDASIPDEDIESSDVEIQNKSNQLNDDVLSEIEEEMYLKDPSTPKEMFINYIESMSEWIEMDKEKFSRSVQARNYARKLGIESEVYKDL